MTDTLKVLGQSAPSAESLTSLVPAVASTQRAVSTIVVCNQSATPTRFRLKVAIADAGDTAAQYLHYDVPIDGNDTLVITIGITLAAADVVYCYATLATLSFNAFGVNVT